MSHDFITSRPNGSSVQPQGDRLPQLLDVAGYDFIDFGASIGGSIEFALASLGGVRGLGVDLDARKVQQSLDAGYECVQADATNLALPDNSVRFVVISHMLEHLPDLKLIETLILSAVRVASEFVFIQGPYFDADDYLAAHGLKYFYSDWSGHTCHFTVRSLLGILEKHGLTDHVIDVIGETRSSNDPFVHPLESPPDQQKYDPDIHPPKPSASFGLPIYKEFACFVRLGDVDDWESLLQAKADSVRYSTGLTCSGGGS